MSWIFAQKILKATITAGQCESQADRNEGLGKFENNDELVERAIKLRKEVATIKENTADRMMVIQEQLIVIREAMYNDIINPATEESPVEGNEVRLNMVRKTQAADMRANLFKISTVIRLLEEAERRLTLAKDRFFESKSQ